MTTLIKKYVPEVAGIAICLGLGYLSGIIMQASDPHWYASLVKPVFNPPNWVFAPAWTILYIMMGIALGKIYKCRAVCGNLFIIFVLQLVFNLLWTPLFFYYHRIGLALIDITLLWLSLCIFIIFSRKNQTITMLFIPYILWVSFALILNLCLYQMNA